LREACDFRSKTTRCGDFSSYSNTIRRAPAVLDFPFNGQGVVPIRNHENCQEAPWAVGVCIPRPTF